jgi:DNA modification methylase
VNRLFPHSSESMPELPDSSVALVVCSPPYHVSLPFDTDEPDEDYLAMLARVFQECYRVLEEGGRACVNCANVGRSPYTFRNHQIGAILLNIGFIARGEVIWSKRAGSAKNSTAWGSWCSASNPTLRDTHEYILCFSKGQYERNRAGVSTITDRDFIDWTRSVWEIRPESATRIGHPAPFPVELPRRCIELYTYLGDLVCDPFLGSGTSAIAAIQAGREWVGYELSREYCDLAEARIAAELQQVRIDFSPAPRPKREPAPALFGETL